MDTRIPTARPRGLERSVRPAQKRFERSNRSRPGNAHPAPAFRPSSRPAIVIRRRPVRPFIGPREMLAMLVLVAACAVILHVGNSIGSAIDEVMSREAVVTLDVTPNLAP